ncbi:MAG: magnesium and cobalt transport protein CorA [Acidobacteria bacterium]|nr:MAG: magnesium and cobalt transport protein CorA [Acidobacteriota bacterium]
MLKLVKKESKKVGLPPGTLLYVGEKRTEKVTIKIIDYDETSLQEKEARTVEDCFPYKNKPTVTWINVDGIHRVDIIETIGKHFGVHSLVLEDILNTGQRPKMDNYGDYLFIVLKMIYCNGKGSEIIAEQISLILGSNFVISFQEEAERDVFNPVRERIRNGTGRIRKMGADYLAYALMDAIVDNYFAVLEKLGEQIELLQEELISDPTPETLHAINHLKRQMIFLRKSVWPLREVVSGLERGESPLIKAETNIFLRDLYDHTIQIMDALETCRDMLSGMLDIYLSSISNKMNGVMKVLTIIATIFIPLTFIAGVYGMNFKYMPELEWRWSYPVLLLAMAVIVVSMLMYFRRKKWL